ncbi:MAG: adenine deaminase C-terminal domain-containing protein, partial [Thermomicrobiales bacterium]
YEANLVVLNDLHRVDVALTLFQGKVVARDGAYLFDAPAYEPPASLMQTVRMAPLLLSDLRLDLSNARTAVKVVSGQIVTQAIDVDPSERDGQAVADTDRDLLKLVCVERHHATGRVGVSYVQGFGLRHGGLASTIAHDAHNIVAVGVDDVDILAAIATVADSQGGIAAIADGKVLGHLPLPIAGLLSDRPLEEVAATYAALEETAKTLGSPLPSPFGLLAFMALSVIPEARVTDRGFIRVG